MTRRKRCWSEIKTKSYPIRPIRAALADKNACKWKTNGFGDVPKSNSTTPSSPWKSNVNKCSLSSADERSFSNGCCHSNRTLPVFVAFPPLVTESVGSLYNVKPCS